MFVFIFLGIFLRWFNFSAFRSKGTTNSEKGCFERSDQNVHAHYRLVETSRKHQLLKDSRSSEDREGQTTQTRTTLNSLTIPQEARVPTSLNIIAQHISSSWNLVLKRIYLLTTIKCYRSELKWVTGSIVTRWPGGNSRFISLLYTQLRLNGVSLGGAEV